MDEFACKETALHKLHPVVKLLVAIAYIIIVISYEKYVIIGLLPLIFYPIVMITIAEIPLELIMGGLTVAIPLVLGIGIFNPLLDKEAAAIVLGIKVSAGIISLVSLLIKCILAVSATIILISTTGINKLAAALHSLHIPRVFIVQLLLTFRYISVLVDEASRAYNAYSLRAPGHKGISKPLWGAFLGQLLLRTFDRAQRVYQAMKLRGFRNEYYGVVVPRISIRDLAYLAFWLVLFIISRLYNLPILLGQVMTEVIK